MGAATVLMPHRYGPRNDGSASTDTSSRLLGCSSCTSQLPSVLESRGLIEVSATSASLDIGLGWEVLSLHSSLSPGGTSVRRCLRSGVADAVQDHSARSYAPAVRPFEVRRVGHVDPRHGTPISYSR